MVSQWLTGPDRHLTRFGEVAAYKEGLYRLTRRTYAWLAPNGSWGETNIGIIDCRGKSILIDTCWDLRLTEEVLQAAGDILSESPVEVVINTHSDGDHCWGNQLFKDRRIIGTRACTEQMRHPGPKELQRIGTAGKWLQAVPLWGLHKFGGYMHHMFQPYDFSNIHVTPPNYTFSGRESISINGVEIIISEVGPAHTAGDATVYVPSARVVYTGDLVFVGVTPVLWSGPVENAILGLKHLLSLDVDFIVPGHGPLAQKQDLQNLMIYWEFIHEALYRRFQKDMPPLEAAEDILFSPEFQKMPFFAWDSPERIVTTAHTLYGNWGRQEKRRLPKRLAIMDLFRKQARVAYALPNATPKRMRGAKGEGLDLYYS